MSTTLSDLIGSDLTFGNDGDRPGYSAPVTGDDIEELLYSEEWPASERIARLEALRGELAGLEAPDFGDDDPARLISQIDDALARLNAGGGQELDPTAIDHDPAAHRETLAPDSDEMAELAAEDEASLEESFDEPIDKAEWIDGDGFDPDRGVR